MYADTVSDAMDEAIKETKRRREIQEAYNKEHGITPKTIVKEIKEIVTNEVVKSDKKKVSKKEKERMLVTLEEEMKEAASKMDFERAIELRNIIYEMKGI